VCANKGVDYSTLLFYNFSAQFLPHQKNWVSLLIFYEILSFIVSSPDSEFAQKENYVDDHTLERQQAVHTYRAVGIHQFNNINRTWIIRLELQLNRTLVFHGASSWLLTPQLEMIPQTGAGATVPRLADIWSRCSFPGQGILHTN